MGFLRKVVDHKKSFGFTTCLGREFCRLAHNGLTNEIIGQKIDLEVLKELGYESTEESS